MNVRRWGGLSQVVGDARYARLDADNTLTGDQFIGGGKPWADVMAFGAKGDNATNDTAAFNSALAALTSGGVLYIPPGTYRLGTRPNAIGTARVTVHICAGATLRAAYPAPGTGSDGLFTINANDVTIEGEGPASLLTQVDAAGIQQAIGIKGSVQRTTLRDFKIDWRDSTITAEQQPLGDSSNYFTGIRTHNDGATDIFIDGLYMTECGNRAMDIRSSKRVRITNCSFVNTGYNNGAGIGGGNQGNAISVENVSDRPAYDVFTGYCYFEKWGDTAIGIPSAHNVTIVGNILRGASDFGATPRSVESGIGLNGSSSLTVVGNVVRNVWSHALILDDHTSGDDWSNNQNTIVGNSLMTSAGVGQHALIQVLGNDFGSRGIVVSDNVLDLTDNTTIPGIVLTGNYLTDVVVANNQIRADAVTATQAGIRCTEGGPRRYAIIGNVINNLGYGMDIQAGLVPTNGIDGIVTGNTITNATVAINVQRKGGPRVFGNYGLDDVMTPAANADATNTTRNSLKHVVRGSYWDGTNPQPFDAYHYMNVTGAAAGRYVIGVAGTDRWAINQTGHFFPIADNAYDVGAASLRVRHVVLAGYQEISKITDPANPPANKGRIYLRDNGSGKMQYVAIFPSGAVQVIATEP